MCKSSLHRPQNYVARTWERSAYYSARNFQCCFCPKPKCNLMYRSNPKSPIPAPPHPGKLLGGGGAFDFFEKCWSNYPLCCQFRRSNAPPVTASKRVKSPTLQEKQNGLPFGNPRRRGYSQKNWVWVCGPLTKTVTPFMTGIYDIPYPM